MHFNVADTNVFALIKWPSLQKRVSKFTPKVNFMRPTPYVNKKGSLRGQAS